jgi:hypothetical protein
MNDTGYREGQTATDPNTGERVIFRGGQWVSHTPARPKRAETTEQDRKALNEASERARIERDVQRVYSDAEKAIDTFDTGPVKSWWMDAITPDEDDGIMGAIGANTIGWLARPLVDDKTFEARDQLKTVNARTSLAASAQLKGVASDRDMGLLRLTGLKDSKSKAENKRIISEARFNSALEQYRAKQKARWVARYGSLAAPAPNGRSFEEISQIAERAFADEYQRLIAQPQPKKKKLPAAPPRASRSSTVTIDINGNPIR